MSPGAAEEVPRVTVPLHLVQDRPRSQHGVVLGRREVTGTFHPHFGRSPSAGVRSEQPAASWSPEKLPAVGWISRCAYPHPHPTPAAHPRMPGRDAKLHPGGVGLAYALCYSFWK